MKKIIYVFLSSLFILSGCGTFLKHINENGTCSERGGYIRLTTTHNLDTGNMYNSEACIGATISLEQYCFGDIIDYGVYVKSKKEGLPSKYHTKTK